GAEPGRGACAEIEPLLMMRPPIGICRRIRPKAARAHRNAPVRLTSTTCRHVSTGISSIGAPFAATPALLNKRSRRPNSRSMRENTMSICSELVTSQAIGTARPGPPAWAAVSSSFSIRRPMRMVSHPSPTSALATARPIPLPAPVTSAILAAMALPSSRGELSIANDGKDRKAGVSKRGGPCGPPPVRRTDLGGGKPVLDCSGCARMVNETLTSGKQADMNASAPARELDLALTLGVAGAIPVGAAFVAPWAGDTLDEQLRHPILLRERMATGPAQSRLAFHQPVRQPDPLVEDEALALPQALLRRHLLQIVQDAAAKMENLFDPERAHIGGRLLATNAAGAEHGDPPAL